MAAKKRHRLIFFVLRPFVRIFCRFKYNVFAPVFQFGKDSKPPYLILANHLSDLDPFFIALCFQFPVFFVASDHIFRWGILSRLIKYLVSPIPKLKSQSDLATVREIMDYLRGGRSVCIFPEGNRSWNGKTGDISPAIGKLVHLLNTNLILCRIDGGYLFSPRWANHLRRGRVECHVVGEYLPEDLKSMSVEQINDLIREKLFVDAMADQQVKKVRYLGKNLAQSIETVLYACPKCGRFSSIHSKGDDAFCRCGLKFSVNPFGYLIGAPFQTISEWDRWQKKHLRLKIEQLFACERPAPLFKDSDQMLYFVKRAQKSERIGKGDFVMLKDRFAFCGPDTDKEFFFRDITDISVIGRRLLQFTLLAGSSYEIKSLIERSAYKYTQAYEFIHACGVQNRKFKN